MTNKTLILSDKADDRIFSDAAERLREHFGDWEFGNILRRPDGSKRLCISRDGQEILLFTDYSDNETALSHPISAGGELRRIFADYCNSEALREQNDSRQFEKNTAVKTKVYFVLLIALGYIAASIVLFILNILLPFLGPALYVIPAAVILFNILIYNKMLELFGNCIWVFAAQGGAAVVLAVLGLISRYLFSVFLIIGGVYILGAAVAAIYHKVTTPKRKG